MNETILEQEQSGLPATRWNDSTLLALSRDTRVWLTHGPDGKQVDDWFDARPHTTLLYTFAKWVNWQDPRWKHPFRPPRIVEIGVRHGVTTLALLHACRETGGTLISFECDPEWARAAKQEISRAGLALWWDLRIQRSDDGEVQAPIDLLWIDGEHNAEQVQKDVDRYAPLVRRDGLILLHDYWSLPHCQGPPVSPPFPSHVSIVVDKMREDRQYEIVCLPWSYGIVIVRKKEP